MKLLIAGCLHPPVTRPFSHSETNPILHVATIALYGLTYANPQSLSCCLIVIILQSRVDPRYVGAPGR